MGGAAVAGSPCRRSVARRRLERTASRIRIAIAKSDTALDPARYTDALQVVAGTNKDAFGTGQILVAANPFNV